MDDDKAIKEFKIIVLGDASVGKSSIINRYIMNCFDTHMANTIGTAFYAKTIFIDGQIVKLMIWDTCGEEKFRAISSLYFNDSDSAILVYDLESPDTITGVSYYLDKLKSDAPENIMINVVGNKCDLVDVSQIRVDKIEGLLQDITGFYQITSAKSGEGIDKLFDKVVKQLIDEDRINKMDVDEFKIESSGIGDLQEKMKENCKC